MDKVVLKKKRKKRMEQGHPWVFENEIQEIQGSPEPGELVEIVSHSGQYLATGYYNPASKITVRVVSYSPIEVMDKAFFVEKFLHCRRYRERLLPNTEACRLVYGEADFLPGLVVDRFGDVLSMQVLSLGMDQRREIIIEALVEVFQPKGIMERSDVPVRELEGLEQRKGVVYGDCPRLVQIRENGLLLEVDLYEGQKTGYFFDQRENRAALRPLMTGWGGRSGIRLQHVDDELKPVNANGKVVTFPYWDGATVLECFAHTGSFSLHACQYGAKKVTCLDISEHAISSARRNVTLNGFDDRVEFVVADAFDYLRKQVKGIEERKLRGQAHTGQKVDTSKPLHAEGRTWDVIVLDPPAFAKNRNAVESACRGYKDINLHALKLINDGGFLVTASCSFHVRSEQFLAAIHEAAVDAGKLLRFVEYRKAGKDHPHVLGVNEGDYLKFAIFEVTSR